MCVSPVDQEQLDKEINDLRKGLKAKVNRLNELQGRSRPVEKIIPLFTFTFVSRINHDKQTS